jgi:hypothetical protein
VEMFAGGNKVAALFELVIGVELCYFSFMLGLHSELALKGLVRNYLRRLVQQPQEEQTNNTSNGEYVQQHANTKGNGVVATEETPSRSSMVGSISRTSLEGHLEQIQRMLNSRKSTSSHSRRSISDDLLGPLAFHVNSIIERIGRKTISDERYQKDQVAVPSTQSAAVSKSVQKAAEESQRFSNKIILVGGFLFFGN